MSWFDTGFPYRANCMIDNSGIGALTQFPARVRLSGINPAWAAGVRFAQGMTLLTHELDAVVVRGGVVHADFWVRMPTIPNDSTMDLQAYLGASHPASVEDAPGVWDDDFVAVWHFKERTGHFIDSTINAHTPSTTQVTSRNWVGDFSGYAVYMDGVDDYIRIEDHADFDITDTLTLEAHVQLLAHATVGSYNSFVGKALGYNISESYGLDQRVADNVGFIFYRLADNSTYEYGSSTVSIGAPSASWKYVAGTINAPGAGACQFYLNGAPIGAASGGSQAIFSSAVPVYIGAASATPTYNPEARFSEVRISKINRSADYIEATDKCLDNTYVTNAGIEARIGGGASKLLSLAKPVVRSNPRYKARTGDLSRLKTWLPIKRVEKIVRGDGS